MKKLRLLTLLLSCAAFSLLSCADDAAEVTLDWESDSRGTLEVFNASNTDVVLFLGDRPTSSGLLGGVKAGQTRLVNICAKVPDCDVGGWAIINGITRDIYNDNASNLTAVTKVDFNAFATYKATEKYRISIDKNSVGENMVKLVNRGRVGLELRKGSPEGEKVAYLPALKTDGVLYANSTDAITLFPYYVLYNKSTKSITTLKATDMKQSVMISPMPASDPTQVGVAYFPNDANEAWDKIMKTLKSPVAYITVSNNVMNQGAYFTNSGSARYYSQSGYDAINSGRQLVFEVEASDPNLDADGNDLDAAREEGEEVGGIKKQLVAMVYGDPVPISFKGKTDLPNILNGYEYTVSIDQVGGEITGTIKRGNKRDLSGQLEDSPPTYE